MNVTCQNIQMHHFRISRLSATNMSIGLVMCHAGHDSMIVLEMLTYLDTMATPRFTAHGREVSSSQPMHPYAFHGPF